MAAYFLTESPRPCPPASRFLPTPVSAMRRNVITLHVPIGGATFSRHRAARRRPFSSSSASVSATRLARNHAQREQWANIMPNRICQRGALKPGACAMAMLMADRRLGG